MNPKPTAIDATRDLVLFADDDPALCCLWAYLFERNGIEVTLATTGAEALAAALARRPKVAILDVWMPRLSGLKVCARIKRDPRTADTFVVLVSGDSDPRVRRKALAAGAGRFLTKPLDDDVLLGIVLERVGIKTGACL